MSKSGVNKLLTINSEGISMQPLLLSGDKVHIKPIIFSRIHVDDIVCFQKKSKTITHRVIYKTNHYLITKGDNNLRSDGKIYPKQIIGKVSLITRNGKQFDPELIYAYQSNLYFQEIKKIVRLFDESEIQYVFLKGLPLYLFYEKTYPRRIYADMDILIHPSQYEHALSIITQQNYKLYLYDFNSSFLGIPIKKRALEITCYKVVRRMTIQIDLHREPWFLISKLGVQNALYPQKKVIELTNEMIEKRRIVSVHGVQCAILAPHHLVVYLAIHLANHVYKGAYRYQFLDIVLRNSTKKVSNFLLYTETASCIKSYKLENYVFPAFILLRKYYHTPLLESFIQSIKPNNYRFRYASKLIHNTLVFNIDRSGSNGVTRFKNLFVLSPVPLYRRWLVFMNPQVIFMILWVGWKYLKRMLLKKK